MKSTGGNWPLYLGVLALSLSIQTGWSQQHDHGGDSADSAEQQEHAAHGRSDSDGQAVMQKGEGKGMMQQKGDGEGMMMNKEGGHEAMMQRMRQKMQQGSTSSSATASAGQDAFMAIKRIVGQLEADSETDWSKVDINALREHLIDMNHVTLNANVVAREIDGGANYSVTGEGRILTAILNMVPVHARQINDELDWSVQYKPMENGIDVTVTAENPEDVSKIRALGFIGFMTQGDHHQAHHLAIAQGGAAEHDHASGHDH